MGVRHQKGEGATRRAPGWPADPRLDEVLRREDEERERRIEALRQRYLAGEYRVEPEALVRKIIEDNLTDELADQDH